MASLVHGTRFAVALCRRAMIKDLPAETEVTSVSLCMLHIETENSTHSSANAFIINSISI